ncbi:hypothetical protein [Marivivens marinus]|uniref:hypothetical protein n=1 Tax=Marivivens marinus TaxID=3110173 RepID=UPI003B84A0E8
MAQRGIINRRMIDTLRDAPPEIVSEALALSVTPDMVPQTDVELIACLASWEWRIFSGQLYKIMTKDPEADEDDETAVLVVPFIPNRAQRKFLDRLHTRNVILKARQLGFTTLIAILWLDHALFNADQRCAIIAHSLEDAGVILRDKVKFAFNNLPSYLIGEEGQNELPLLWLSKDSETEIVFGHNNSSVRVATSARSGTYHRLHVSEMGKIGAKFPLKAKEIVTGSLPTVPKTGITVIESTAEGRSGEFYRIATRAEKNTQIAEATGRRLAAKAWNFHFFPWWEEAAYVEDPANVDLTPADEEYFLNLESQIGRKITPEQRAWYVMTREDEQGGDAEKMWQEYPSTPEEAWKASTEGTWFAKQLAAARKQGRIVPSLPKLTTVATHTFWDIGHGDGTSIWLGQEVGAQFRWVGFIEEWEEDYEFYCRRLDEEADKHGYRWGYHHLPHDAIQKRQQMKARVGREGRRVNSAEEMLQTLRPDWRFHIVPRVDRVINGINAVREEFASYWFDATECAAGIVHLERYSKKRNTVQGGYTDEPLHDEHSEAADALRQKAQGYRPLASIPRNHEAHGRRPRPHRRAISGMAV